jgi:cytidine deaminase
VTAPEDFIVEPDTPAFQHVLSRLPERLRAQLGVGLVRGVLASDRVAECLAELGWEIEQLMTALLPVAAAHALAPISNFTVGAVVLGMPPAAANRGPGSLYLGANMEFRGEALPLLPFTIHAEQSATNNAWLHGEQGVRILAVNAPPCGVCRQFLKELTTANGSLKVIHGQSADESGGPYETYALSALLPKAFGPGDLGVRGGLMRVEDHQLTLDATDPLAQAALAAANSCYAPYTQAYAGVALRGADQKIYPGRYAENAAFNPSLLPVQSALAFMRMQSAAAADWRIIEAVLVEASSEHTSQREVTRLLVESVGPGAKLTCYAL